VDKLFVSVRRRAGRRKIIKKLFIFSLHFSKQQPRRVFDMRSDWVCNWMCTNTRTKPILTSTCEIFSDENGNV
jgi:hypothetical protein